MKLIHCADIHLDSPLRTHLSREEAGNRNAEITQTFLELTRYAQREGVAVVLIAGDLFDERRVSPQTLDMVLFAMEATPQVDYLYLPGNHDARVLASRPLPPNVKCFSRTLQRFSYGEVCVWGLELTKENALSFYDELSLPSEGIHILALHGQVATAAGEGLIHLGRLRGRNIDYLALGHIHSHRLERLDSRGLWAYSGCLEARGFDETGEKGFVLLETSPAEVKVQFVPFARRRSHALEVDITGLTTNSQVYAAIREETSAIPAGDLVQVTLTGKRSLLADISRQYLSQLLSGSFYALELKDGWQLAAREFEPDISLKGEFIRLALEQELPDGDKELLIRIGLEALAGEELSL